MKQKKSGGAWKILVVIVIIIFSFAAGIFISPVFMAQSYDNSPLPSGENENQSIAGLIPANASIEGNAIYLTNGCNAITFDVTDDQAYSIYNGIDGSLGVRPLTHDIFKDVLGDFGIQVSQIRMDRFEDDIYKARIYFRKDDKVLDIDVRPSDAIAMATRLGKTVYVDQQLMDSKSVDIC